MTNQMVWLVPSFYGDLRLEAMDGKATRLIVEQATVREKEALTKLAAIAAKKGWSVTAGELGEGKHVLHAPIQKVAAALTKVLKPGRETVSAIRIAGGKIEEVRETHFVDDKPATATVPYREPEKAGKPPLRVEVTPPAVATTVAKPQRGCPPPDFPSAELKATAVLSAFLDDVQLADFKKYNRFVSVGGTTGHLYMVTSRHALGALQKYERSLYDLNENMPICTHDHDVPAPEELLALHLLVTLPGHESYIRHLE